MINNGYGFDEDYVLWSDATSCHVLLGVCLVGRSCRIRVYSS